ncbi:MAG: hypothetical protein DWI27_07300 [Planctomycetota bacterium]|nr:MAG: hypothetical protein DWI27_07300 [Planctomycetota bacterium]
MMTGIPSGKPSPRERGQFVLCGCQGGGEAALRLRQSETLPAFAPAAWRRGVATFRIGPAGFDPPDDFFPDFVFARTVVRSLGQSSGSTVEVAAARVRELVGGGAWDAVHVWSRDPRGELPVAEIRAAVAVACGHDPAADAVARPGGLVLDIVLDSIDRWWVGWHRAGTPSSTWPGGVYPGRLPESAVSRAWLKLDEALAVFGLEPTAGELAIELGAAPGGACQRLLEAGLEVIGVDAALVDDRVAGHPRFTQWRMRAREVPLKKFQRCDWLLTDMNIDPASTMAALARVLTGGTARPRGIIATLKLPEWSRSAEIDGWLDAFRSWGYEPKARQLSTAGREICIAARPVGRGTATPRRRATRRRGE